MRSRERTVRRARGAEGHRPGNAQEKTGRDTEYNHLWSFFTDPENRSRYPHWPAVACRLVGQFRVQAARFLDDPNFEQLARRLCSVSPHFDVLWARHETRDSGIADIEVQAAPGPRTTFRQVTLGFHERPEPLLMLYLPGP